jgi:hypothetical protein
MTPWTLRIIALVFGAIAVSAVVAQAVRGEPIDATAIVLAIVTAISGFLAGAAAQRPPSPSGGAGGGVGVVLLLAALGSQACAPCLAESAVVSALDAGVTAADDAVGDAGGEDFDTAIDISRGAVALGRAAVEGCGLLRDGAGWEQWVGLALETAVGLAAHFGAAAEGDIPATPPEELTAAITALRAE